MVEQRKSTYRRPASKEARERANAYLRRYRAEHPERVRAWRNAYILRKAARILAEQADHKGGEQHAGH